MKPSKGIEMVTIGDRKYIVTKEAADMLRVTKRTVRKLMQTKVLRYVRLDNKVVLINYDDVIEYKNRSLI